MRTLQQRFFDRRVKMLDLEQYVYHGSPLDGMLDILRAGCLIPQGHNELPAEAMLSVSVEDCSMPYFSDGDKVTGFHAQPRLRIAMLDSFFEACMLPQSSDVCDDYEVWGSRLGYRSFHRGQPEMSSRQFMELIDRPGIDGLTRPYLNHIYAQGRDWLSSPSFRDEAEVSLNESGCRATWESICGLYVLGEEFDDVQEGWMSVVWHAAKRGIIDNAEKRRLQRKINKMKGQAA